MVCCNKTGNTFTHNLLNAVRTRTNASLSQFILKAKSMPSLARSIPLQFCTEGLSSHSPSSVKSLSNIRGRFAKSKRKLIIFPQLQCSSQSCRGTDVWESEPSPSRNSEQLTNSRNADQRQISRLDSKKEGCTHLSLFLWARAEISLIHYIIHYIRVVYKAVRLLVIKQTGNNGIMLPKIGGYIYTNNFSPTREWVSASYVLKAQAASKQSQSKELYAKDLHSP